MFAQEQEEFEYWRITDPSITCTACSCPVRVALRALANKKFTWVGLRKDIRNPDKLTTLTIKVNKKDAENEKIGIIEAAQEVGKFYDCQWEQITEKNFLSASPPLYPIRDHLFKGLPSLFLSSIWILLPFLPPFAPLTLTIITISLSVLSTMAILYAGKEIFQRAYSMAKKRYLTMDTQFAIATLLSVIVSFLAFGIPGLSLLFDAALLVLGFRHIGLAVEEWANKRLDNDSYYTDSLPKTVDVLMRAQDESKARPGPTNILELKEGDIIEIKPGMVIPCDGTCESKTATVNAEEFSGRKDAVSVNYGESLLQGHQVLGSPLNLKVGKKVIESTLAQRQSEIEGALDSRMDMESYTDHLSSHFVKGIFIVAFLAFGFVTLYSYFVAAAVIGVALTLAFKTFLGVLVAACPCTLGAIIPLIIKVATQKCAANGATVRDGKVLENAPKAKYIVFDLNGTLTTGEKKVQTIGWMNNLDKKLSKQWILGYVKFLEESCPHLVANAIHMHLKNKKLHCPLEEEAKNISDYKKGRGIKIADKELMIGNASLMHEKLGGAFVDNFPEIKPLTQRIYMAYDNRLIGYIDIAEKIKPEAPAVLNYFRSQGLGVKMCTGADEKTARAYGDILEFANDDIEANCVEAEGKAHPKVDYLKKLKEEGGVIFIGDAGNDSKPIACANIDGVGVAIASPSTTTAAKEGSGAYISGYSLWPLVQMYAIAKQTLFDIKLSLGVSLLYNVASFVFMGGLALLWLGLAINPGFGAAFMVGQALVVLIFAAIFQAWPVPKNPALITEAAPLLAKPKTLEPVDALLPVNYGLTSSKTYSNKSTFTAASKNLIRSLTNFKPEGRKERPEEGTALLPLSSSRLEIVNSG